MLHRKWPAEVFPRLGTSFCWVKFICEPLWMIHANIHLVAHQTNKIQSCFQLNFLNLYFEYYYHFEDVLNKGIR